MKFFIQNVKFFLQKQNHFFIQSDHSTSNTYAEKKCRLIYRFDISARCVKQSVLEWKNTCFRVRGKKNRLLILMPFAFNHSTVGANNNSISNKLSPSKLSIFSFFLGIMHIFQSIELGIYCMSNEIIQINNAVVSASCLYVCDMT